MNLYKTVSIYRANLHSPNKKLYILSLFILCYIGLLIGFQKNYFITDYTVWVALALSFYIIHPDKTEPNNKKYLWWSLLFILLTLLSGVQTFYFLAIGLSILFVIESFAGSIGYLPLYLLCLLSPTFKYFNNMLGFPVRLKLSEWAGSALKLTGNKTEVVGNIIVMNGNEFSVDPACIGLKMMAFSILTGLLIMAFFQRQTNKSFGFMVSAAILLIIVGFNIIANLLRIVLLTLFEIAPENPNHDITGLICFLLYVIIPSYFVIKWMAGKIRISSIAVNHKNHSCRKILILNLMLVAAILTTGFIYRNKQKATCTQLRQFKLTGYSKEIVNEDVQKFEKQGVLIYVKPLSRFYGAEHNPMICWTGSGYQFSRINKQIIGQKEIYTGTLKKGTDIIYSAWWFDNGQYQTIKQTDWRWRALKGDNFYLVNINSGNEKLLMKEIKRLL